MTPDLIAMYALLLSLLGGGSGGVPDINPPREMVLKPGAQIIAIGDSITAAGGYLKDVDAVLAAKYPELKLPPIRNVGISGQKAEDLVTRFQHDVVDQKPAVVTISIGINDVWHRMEQPHDPRVVADYWSNVAKMIEMATKAGIKVIVLTPTVIGEDPNNSSNLRLWVYVESERQAARQGKCTMIDVHTMFVTALAKRPASVTDKEHWLTSDGVHMKPLGDALMAIGVLRGLGVPDSALVPAAN